MKIIKYLWLKVNRYACLYIIKIKNLQANNINSYIKN